MATISLDLRSRILAAYDKGDCTRAHVAQRFAVSEGMVKKLLQQRRATGDIADRHYFSGNKPRLREAHGEALLAAVTQKPDRTLAELKAHLKLGCTLQAIHYVLQELDLTYKKRRCMPPSRTAQTSPARGLRGAKGRAR
jgi:transposase